MEEKVLFTYQKDENGEYTIKQFFTLSEFIERVKKLVTSSGSCSVNITQRVKKRATFR